MRKYWLHNRTHAPFNSTITAYHRVHTSNVKSNKFCANAFQIDTYMKTFCNMSKTLEKREKSYELNWFCFTGEEPPHKTDMNSESKNKNDEESHRKRKHRARTLQWEKRTTHVASCPAERLPLDRFVKKKKKKQRTSDACLRCIGILITLLVALGYRRAQKNPPV